MKYTCKFSGRKAGAIGIFYPCTVTVDASNEHEAATRVYETHEHVTGLQVTQEPSPKEIGHD